MVRHRLTGIATIIMFFSLICLGSYSIELGQIIFIPQTDITRVIVGNSDVVSAVPVKDGVVITAKNVGSSEVMIFGEKGTTTESILVRVPSREKEKALTILENLGLVLEKDGGHYVIKGRVPDQRTFSYVEGLAAIIDSEVRLDLAVDQDLAQSELEGLLDGLGIKLNMISQTAVLTGSVPSKDLEEGILILVSSVYSEAVSLLEIKEEVQVADLPKLKYKGLKVTDYGEVVILEGKAASEEEKNALGQIFEAYRQNVVNMLVVESKEAPLFQSLFADLGSLTLERVGGTVVLSGTTDTLAGFNLAADLFNCLYPDGVMKVQISSAERVLTEWAQILDLELVAVGEMYAIKGQGEESQVLVEIGRMYGKSVFVIRKEENALEFLRALLEIEDVEMQTFRDTLYVRGLPKEVRGDFELAANALFPKVVFLSEEVNPKDPYTVQVSGFYITEKDLDQISLNAAKLTQGWQEVVLSWEEIGIIKELAKEWEIKQPSVLTYPGESTSIHTGGEIPIPFGDGVEWRQFGVSLDCQFGFAENGLIPGYLNIVVSDLDWGNGVTVQGTSLPALKSYSYAGNVELPKGGGVLLLRYWSSKEGWIKKSLPVLESLPVLGRFLFGTRSQQAQSQIMCVLVEVN
ncbi:MAG TPA: pilus assembly protein N-terminal domain-containing protein [Bacillota bacterium]|nr:pilus assembly protein N-terminal domain-containing protein [Bacillota bacterium]HPT60243.1 pilus assembly protein N-terminal domain-containing protein [Bacillota bacterium]